MNFTESLVTLVKKRPCWFVIVNSKNEDFLDRAKKCDKLTFHSVFHRMSLTVMNTKYGCLVCLPRIRKGKEAPRVFFLNA